MNQMFQNIQDTVTKVTANQMYLTNVYDQTHPQHKNMALKITMQSYMVIASTTKT
jgi:hypothetical protein